MSPVSEAMTRGAGCGKSARPDLWEPREGNLPGPPGRIGLLRRAIPSAELRCSSSTYFQYDFVVAPCSTSVSRASPRPLRLFWD